MGVGFVMAMSYMSYLKPIPTPALPFKGRVNKLDLPLKGFAFFAPLR